MRYADLLPGSDAVRNLERLLLQALAIPKQLDELESNWTGPTADGGRAEKSLRDFRDRVNERSQFIGEVAAASILKETIPPVRTFGSALELRVAYEPLRAWINGVVANIQRELESIERRRALLVSVAATVITAIAAIFAFASAVFEGLALKGRF